MFLKWLGSNQLRLEQTEMYAQNSQLVSRLYVLTEVFDPTKAGLVANFGRINKITQQFEKEGDPVLMLGVATENGFLYDCSLPPEFLRSEGLAGVSLSAQVDTGQMDSVNKKVYQVFTSGIYAFYVEPSLAGGLVPVPDNVLELINRIAAVEEDATNFKGTVILKDGSVEMDAAYTNDVVGKGGQAVATVGMINRFSGAAGDYAPYIGENGNWHEYRIATNAFEDTGIKALANLSATVETLEPSTHATVTVTGDGTNTQQLNFGIPRGADGTNGADGQGVFGVTVENGDLVLYTQDVIGADFEIREDGYLAINFNS